MRVLYLVHRIPYPPDKGDKIRSFRWLECLAERHEIHLVTFCDDPSDLVHRPVLEKLCESVQIFDLDPRFKRIASVLRLPNGRPMSLSYFENEEARTAVDAIIEATSPDVVLCFSAPMAEYVRGRGIPVVMDMVDVDSAKFEAYARTSSFVERWLYGIEGRRLARYEEKLVEELDAVLLCTDQECASLRDRSPDGRIESIPNGASPPPAEKLPGERLSNEIIFIGAMDYRANVDAVEFGARDIMPRVLESVPDAVFRIIGRDPTPAVKALEKLDGVEVLGGQADLEPFLRTAAVSLLPFRIARGIQNKALEAMGWEIPVVTAPTVAASMGAEPGKHLLVGTSAEQYAIGTTYLLDDRELGRIMGQAGRAYVVENFDWDKSAEHLDRVLSEVAGVHAP